MGTERVSNNSVFIKGNTVQPCYSLALLATTSLLVHGKKCCRSKFGVVARLILYINKINWCSRKHGLVVSLVL